MLSFLMSLRDVLTTSLHGAAAAPTIKSVELATLIVQTMRIALPAVTDHDTVSQQDFFYGLLDLTHHWRIF